MRLPWLPCLLVTSVLSSTVYGQHLTAPDAPCRNGGSEADRKKCFIEAGERADQALNETYKKILARLSSSEEESLRKAERLWIQFRDASCLAESSLYETKMDIQTVFAACIEAETRERTRDLLAVYRGRLEI